MEVLNRLKDSSTEAVESLNSFENFKQYMHIERDPLESEYYSLLSNAYKQDKSQLILVCGSVGDGKSHIKSYLYNKYDFIKYNFKVHNDATKSYNPTETCMDTLNRVLEPFSDENIEITKEN